MVELGTLNQSQCTFSFGTIEPLTQPVSFGSKSSDSNAKILKVVRCESKPIPCHIVRVEA